MNRHLYKLESASLIIDPFDLEDHRSCSIRTAGDHFVLMFHPAFHNGTSLQSRIDISADGIPQFRTVRHLRATGNSIGIRVGVNKSIESAAIEIIPLSIPVKLKHISHVVAGTRAVILISTILSYQFRKEFFVDDGKSHLMFHILDSPPIKIQFHRCIFYWCNAFR